MSSASDVSVQQYSSLAGFVYVFNIMMGNGPLALPAAYLHAGWLLSTIVLVCLAFLSFISFTFVVESMSLTNGVSRLKKDVEGEDQKSESPADRDFDGLSEGPSGRGQMRPDSMEITRKYELGQMFKMYFGRTGNVLFYVSLVVYLFGDMSIYAAAVPKSLRNVVCGSNLTDVIISEEEACWTGVGLTRGQVYRIFVAGFALCTGPFLFCNMTTSRWLQLGTAGVRWFTFLLLIALGIDRAIVIRTENVHTLSKLGGGQNLLTFSMSNSSIPNPPMARIQGIPTLFGVAVYVFVCHHSLPGVITPIRNKHHLIRRIFVPLFICALAFNLLMAGTGSAAFKEIKDLYTLNFVPDGYSYRYFKIPPELATVIGYFVSLFPVFALTTNFPILGCTLLGNLMVLCNMCSCSQSPRSQRVLRFTMPFVVLLPPIIVALITDDIGFLVAFTGAFAGCAIQYVIPAILVYRARRYMLCTLEEENSEPQAALTGDDDEQPLCSTSSNHVVNSLIKRGTPSGLFNSLSVWYKHCSRMRIDTPFASPFQHIAWMALLYIWAAVCIAVVLIGKIYPL